MQHYEYKVVPAPSKGLKAKGVRGGESRFCYAVEELLNAMAGNGWEYQRAETLPSIERSGLTGSTTEWRNLLVFRRLRESDATAFQPQLLRAPSDEDEAPELAHDMENLVPDDGVENNQTTTAIGPALSILARARSAIIKKT